MGIVKATALALETQVRTGSIPPRLITPELLRFIARENRLLGEIVSVLPRVLIVGEGGAGKSTLLRQMLARAAAAGRVPVWVSLAKLPSDEPLSIPVLIAWLVQQAESLAVGQINREFFASLAASGQLVIGFDALDECATLVQRQRVRGLLVEVAREWPRCQIFITSRAAALDDTPLPIAPPAKPPEPDQFIALTPLPFTSTDVAPFLRVTFDDGEALAQKLLARTGIEALLETPLTLTLVALVSRTPRGLPTTRTPLFKLVLDTVAEHWEDFKGGQPPPDGLDPFQRLDVLRRLGWAAQEAGGDALGADRALAAIADAPDRDIASRARRVLAGLARRNLLLRAETADDGSFELRALHFSHPQFREYLAGAYLAEQFIGDATAAATSMAGHWFDSRWLDALHFAAATLEARVAQPDALLRAALAADDEYRDLLHRPEFLVAQLLARLTSADAGIVSQVVGVLEAATSEPALRDVAADALLKLGQHVPAHAAIERFAKGTGAAAAFPFDDTVDYRERRESLPWRLRAIETYAAVAGNASALAILRTLPPSLGLEGDLAYALTHVRLGDTPGAETLLRRQFDAANDPDRHAIAAKMDQAGLGARFNEWLTAIVDAPDTGVWRAQLARDRGLIRDDSAVWTGLFERARAALAALPPNENFAPSSVTNAINAATEILPGGTALPAARALIQAGLHRDAVLWYVAPRLLKDPALKAEAVRRLTEYVVGAPRQPFASRPDWSRLNGAVSALIGVDDDALAVPALLELLREGDPDDFRLSQVVASLQTRGQAGVAFDQLLASIDASTPVKRTGWWRLAAQLDRDGVHAALDARYRRGDPEDDARRLMAEWNALGLDVVARDWLESIGADKSDVRAQKFLHTLTTHEADTAFTDYARQALYGGVFDDPGAEPDSPPWTLDDYEKAFDQALKTGSYVDERDNEQSATPRELAWLLSSIASLSDPARALAHADRWIAQIDANAADPDRAEKLGDALLALSSQGFHQRRWSELAAGTARALPPAQRVDLLVWLRANA